ncbi:MAG: two-component sensor histidine kinase [Rhodospirillales bacterium]|nr:two-component sensor histidine kinase [Rhodospirillales bacterium]
MDNLFSIVFQHLPNPTLIIASDRTITYANTAAKSVFDSIFIGKDLALTLRHPEVLNAVDRSIADGTSEEGEFSIPGPLSLVFELHTVPIPDTQSPGSGLSFVLLSLLDKTKIARAEEMRADFVANASHELRSPLTAILGFIETLQGPASNDATARVRFLGIMDREAERMNRLIDDLLRLSRVEIDEHVRPRGQVDVIACIRNVFELLEPRAKAKNMSLTLIADHHPGPINGDSDQLIQVFRNLIENAVHYGDEGTEVRVVVEERIDRPNIPENGIAVHVQDKGRGIAKQHIPRLTERFYRVDGARTRHNSSASISTGLGLAIVKHIVNRHRGRLKIESEVNSGSTFSVFLPTE